MAEEFPSRGITEEEVKVLIGQEVLKYLELEDRLDAYADLRWDVDQAERDLRALLDSGSRPSTLRSETLVGNLNQYTELCLALYESATKIDLLAKVYEEHFPEGELLSEQRAINTIRSIQEHELVERRDIMLKLVSSYMELRNFFIKTAAKVRGESVGS